MGHPKTGLPNLWMNVGYVKVEIVNVGQEIVQIVAQTLQYLLVTILDDELDKVAAQCFEDSVNVQFFKEQKIKVSIQSRSTSNHILSILLAVDIRRNVTRSS